MLVLCWCSFGEGKGNIHGCGMGCFGVGVGSVAGNELWGSFLYSTVRTRFLAFLILCRVNSYLSSSLELTAFGSKYGVFGLVCMRQQEDEVRFSQGIQGAWGLMR